MVSIAEPPTVHGLSVRAIPGTWSVAQVKRREERAVEKAVRAAGVFTYLPIVKVTHLYRNGRREVVERPMFHEYLFVAWEWDAQRGDILGAKGVHGLLPVSRQKQLVSELDAIQKVLAVNAFVDVGNWFKPGITARVTSGPFQGITGKIHERRGHRVFLVGVEMLGQAVELEVEDWQLEPVN
jgi:transcription antitermination factor NusG